MIKQSELEEGIHEIPEGELILIVSTKRGSEGTIAAFDKVDPYKGKFGRTIFRVKKRPILGLKRLKFGDQVLPSLYEKPGSSWQKERRLCATEKIYVGKQEIADALRSMEDFHIYAPIIEKMEKPYHIE